MVFFGYPKHKQKNFKICMTTFWNSKFTLNQNYFDPTSRWRGLDKINVHAVYNLQFFNGHRASCLWFIKHYQTKENWKSNVMTIYKIFSSLYGSGFFPKEKNYYAFVVQKCKKHTFFAWNFDMNVYQYHTP
jgi:hypothetical protein